MIAYEFYWHEKGKNDHLIGILPERRRNPERITKESIMKWVRMVLGDITDFNCNNIYFIQIEI
jgi:hypothetical protein